MYLAPPIRTRCESLHPCLGPSTQTTTPRRRCRQRALTRDSTERSLFSYPRPSIGYITPSLRSPRPGRSGTGTLRTLSGPPSGCRIRRTRDTDLGSFSMATWRRLWPFRPERRSRWMSCLWEGATAVVYSLRYCHLFNFHCCLDFLWRNSDR